MAALVPQRNAEESFSGAFAGNELVIARVNVVGQQVRGFGVGARDQNRGHVQSRPPPAAQLPASESLPTVGTRTFPPR